MLSEMKIWSTMEFSSDVLDSGFVLCDVVVVGVDDVVVVWGLVYLGIVMPCLEDEDDMLWAGITSVWGKRGDSYF